MRKHVQIGETYNNLTVLSRVENYVSRNGIQFTQWLCQCVCGNQVVVLGSSLTTGHTKSCGCLSKRPKVRDEIMVGHRFGRLTVVSRAESRKIPSGSVYDMWNCTCDCGNHTVSFGRNLRNGTTQSCGCLRVERQAEAKREPKAEGWTRLYLDQHGIDYEYQKTFPNLTGENDGLLSYDFWIPDRNLLIELNGLQHYQPIDWFGGERTFVIQQRHDKLKSGFARAHDYELTIIMTDHISKKNLFRQLDSVFA